MTSSNVFNQSSSFNAKDNVAKHQFSLLYANPENNLEKNFSIDVRSELKKYRKMIHSGESIDFIEASFIVDGASKIWAKKVMFLYKLTVQIADSFGRQTSTDKATQSEPSTVPCSSRKKTNSKSKEVEEFRSLDDLQPAENNSLDMVEVHSLEKSAHLGDLELSMEIFERKDPENTGLPLFESDGECFGNFWDFGLTHNSFHEGGALLLPSFPKNTSFETEEQESVLQHEDYGSIEMAVPPIVVDTWSEDTTAKNKAATEILSEEEVEDLDMISALLNVSGEQPIKSKVLKSSTNSPVSAFLKDKYFPDIFNQKLKLHSRPRDKIFLQIARTAQLEREQEIKARKKGMKRTFDALLDDALSSEENRLDLEQLNQHLSEEFLQVLQNPELQMTLQNRRTERALAITENVVPESIVNSDVIMPVAILNETSMWHVKPIGPFSTSRTDDDAFVGDDRPGFMQSIGGPAYVLFQNEDGHPVCNTEPSSSYQNCLGICDRDVDLPSQMDMDQSCPLEIELPRSSSLSYGMDELPIFDQGLEIEPFHSGAIETEDFEQTLKNKVDAYFQKVHCFTLETELSLVVKKWEDKVKSIIEETKSRGTFDFNEYKEKLMEHLEEGHEDSIMFKDLCRGKARWQICRYFLVSLQMANDYNIGINTSSDSHGACNLSLTLLSPRTTCRSTTDNSDIGASMDFCDSSTNQTPTTIHP